MASLPSQHPHLALHLSDRALTPIISSSSSSSTTTPKNSSKPHASSKPRPPKTFSTSPPSSSEDDVEDSEDDDDSQQDVDQEQDEKFQALSELTSTALASYDTAKRLEKGAPLRTMVEYPGQDGPVVLHSYMCPMSLTLGIPGRKGSNDSLRTAGGLVAGDEDGGGGESTTTAGGNGHGHGHGHRTPTNKLSKLSLRNTTHSDLDGTDEEDNHHTTTGSEDSPNAPPMLIGTVVAPKAEDLRDARRAASRLERVAKVFQTEWLSTGVEGGAGDGGAPGT